MKEIRFMLEHQIDLVVQLQHLKPSSASGTLQNRQCEQTTSSCHS